MNKQQIEQNIKNMEAEIAKMKEELNKPEKFEFHYPPDNTYKLINSVAHSGYSGTDKIALEYNLYRISEDNATAEALRNKQGNFIGALFEQIDVDYAEGINWDNTNDKYYLEYYTDTMEWIVQLSKYSKSPEVVYTSELQVANRAAELLNSGKVQYPTT